MHSASLSSRFERLNQTVTKEQIRQALQMETKGSLSDIGTPLSILLSPQMVKKLFTKKIPRDAEEIRIPVFVLKKAMPFEEICKDLDIHPLAPEKGSQYRFAPGGIVSVSVFDLFKFTNPEVLCIPCFDARIADSNTLFMPTQIPIFERCTQFLNPENKDKKIGVDTLSDHRVVVGTTVYHKTWPAGTAVVCVDRDT